jgi:hypothetical protein
MKRIFGIGVAAAAVVVLHAPGASARQCAAGFTESRSPSGLTVTGDTCANGRKVALRTAAVVPTGCIKTKGRKLTFRAPCVRLGYRCTAASLLAGKSLRVTCTRGAKRIRFAY